LECNLANIYFIIDKHNDITNPEVYDIVIDILNNPYKEYKKDDKLGLILQMPFAYAPFPLSTIITILPFLDGFPSKSTFLEHLCPSIY